MNFQPNEFWNGKNVLITGINGFIGGNLAKELVKVGANVFGLLRNNKKNTLLYYEKLDTKITLIHGDLSDKELISGILTEERIQVVFHLAAQVEVGVAQKNPYLTFETNIKGTYTLLDAIRQYPDQICSVVVASTDKSYGPYSIDKMPYQEDYPLIPKYPYDVSKACADMITQCFCSELYKLPIVITRFCNIFGPGQLNFSALIPDAIRSALGYSEFIPRGNGQQVRDFLYVDDVVDLYLKLAEALTHDPEKYRGQVFNAGTNSPKKVKDVLLEVFSALGKEQEFRPIERLMSDRRTSGEIDCQYMDYQKAYAYFQWRPQYTFKQGLEKTIEWFRHYLENPKGQR